MKILVLNPFIDASHEISTCLKGKGAAVLLPSNSDEAMKMVRLHGSSIDLAILHREPKTGGEAKGDLSLSFISQLRGDPAQVDLPVIVTSSVWGDAEFVAHQEGTFGANAYLHWPVSPELLVQTIETMFDGAAPWVSEAAAGESAAAEKSAPTPQLAAPELAPPPPPPPGTATIMAAGEPIVPNIILEESRVNLPRPAPGAAAELGISLVFDSPDQSAPVIVSGHGAAPALPLVESPAPDLALESSGLPAEPMLAAPTSPTSNDELEPHERLMLAASAHAAANAPENATQLIQLGQEAVSLESPPSPEPGGSLSSLIDTLKSNSGNEELADLDLADPLAAALTPPPARADSHPSPSAAGDSEEELSANLPYLFGSKKAPANHGLSAESIVKQVMMFAEPVGDAVVPGGAVTSPDEETLKKYLLLREQDVAVLSNQLKAAREQLLSFDKKLKEANGQILELRHVVNEQQRRIEDADQGAERLVASLQKENEELQFQAKVKTDKVKVMELQVRQATEEVEHLKERVRADIRKIRVREKELSNKLEIMRRDSEALITARENKIVELKRKVDLLEFNLDLLQDQYSREKDNSAQLKERLGKAAQVVRVAGGLLDSSPQSGERAGVSAGVNASVTGDMPRASGVRETA